MTWATWTFLMGSTVAVSVAVATWYAAWSFRYRIEWLGVTAEISFAAAIFFAAGAAISALVSHHP